jgi:uncharacterized protein YfaS (alpha-2-macroglobulin family)
VQNREAEDTAYLWVPGQSALWAGTQQERIRMVADKKSYAPGDTAHVLIVTSQEPTSVLVGAEGNGLYSAQVVKSSGGSVTVDIPVQPEFAPNFYVSAAFIRDNKFYSGNKSLKVPPTQHVMTVQLTPSRPQYQPGQAGAYTIQATDSAGKPVADADFSLGVVDEAIYAIEPETMGSIVNAFYGTIYSKVTTDSSLSYYFSGQAGKRAMQLAVGAGSGRNCRPWLSLNPSGWCSRRSGRRFRIQRFGWRTYAPITVDWLRSSSTIRMPLHRGVRRHGA